MSLVHISCETCRGYGYLICSSCFCKQCQGSGAVQCTACRSGRVICRLCQGTSKIGVRRGWFVFEHTVEEKCNDCSSGTVGCTACKGTQSTTCLACNGTKHTAACSYCSGKHRISCRQCAGSGRKDSEWAQSLRSLSAEDLRFEHEKLRSKRASLEHKLSRLETEHDRASDHYSHWEDRATNEGWLDVFYSAGNEKPVDAAKAKVKACAKELAALDEALDLVDKQKCAGSGRKDGEWAQSLQSPSVEDLRFEHEKLRSKRASLEHKLSRLETEHDRASDYYSHWEDRATSEGWLDVFYSAGNEKPVDAAKAKVKACAKELAALDEALDLADK
jgi:hypothetical protein